MKLIKTMAIMIALLFLLVTVNAQDPNDFCDVKTVSGSESICRTTETRNLVNSTAVTNFWNWCRNAGTSTCVWEIVGKGTNQGVFQGGEFWNYGSPHVILNSSIGGDPVNFVKPGDLGKRVIIRLKGNGTLVTGYQGVNSDAFGDNLCDKYASVPKAANIHVDAIEMLPLNPDGSCGGVLVVGSNSVNGGTVTVNDYIEANRSSLASGMIGEMGRDCTGNIFAGRVDVPSIRTVKILNGNKTRDYSMKVTGGYACQIWPGGDPSKPEWRVANGIHTYAYAADIYTEFDEDDGIWIVNEDNSKPVIFEAGNVEGVMSHTGLEVCGTTFVESLDMSVASGTDYCTALKVISGDRTDTSNFAINCAGRISCPLQHQYHPDTPNVAPTTTLTVEKDDVCMVDGKANLNYVAACNDGDGRANLEQCSINFGDGRSLDLKFSGFPTANGYTAVPSGSTYATHEYTTSGSRTVTVTAKDYLGQTSTQTKSINVRTENQRPYIEGPTITFDKDPPRAPVTATFSGGGCFDNDGTIVTCTLTVDTTTYAYDGSPVTHLFETAGNHSYSLSAKDDCGATPMALWFALIEIFGDNNPPTATLEISPAGDNTYLKTISGGSPLGTILRAKCNEHPDDKAAGGYIEQCILEYEVGSASPTIEELVGASDWTEGSYVWRDHTYNNTGASTKTITAKMTAIDNDGGTSFDTVEITIEPNPGPEAGVEALLNQIPVRAWCSEPTNDLATCMLDYGDGTSEDLCSIYGCPTGSIEHTTTHTFNFSQCPNECCTPSVTATDSAGTSAYGSTAPVQVCSPTEQPPCEEPPPAEQVGTVIAVNGFFVTKGADPQAIDGSVTATVSEVPQCNGSSTITKGLAEFSIGPQNCFLVQGQTYNLILEISGVPPGETGVMFDTATITFKA